MVSIITDLQTQLSISNNNNGIKTKEKPVTLLQRCAAFRVFLKDTNWTKKYAAFVTPIGYVVIL